MTIRTVSYTVITCDKCGKERKLEDFDRKDVEGWDLEKDECDECVIKRETVKICPECNKPVVGEFIFHNLETDKIMCEKCYEEGKDKTIEMADEGKVKDRKQKGHRYGQGCGRNQGRTREKQKGYIGK